MKNYLATFLIALITSVGVVSFSNPAIWDTPPNILGSISYPTSLDTLTNPSGTDSVKTVSHSSQHSNANDAIEAIEAKAGTGASTPTLGTLLYGNGTGSSIWSASPSITGLTLSGQGLFGSFISNASSTIIGNLNITGNSTSTNATTTNFFSTTASTTNAYGTNINGFGLTTCNSGSFLQWSGGVFACNDPGGATVTLSSYEEASAGTDVINTAVDLVANQVIFLKGYCSGNQATTMQLGYRWLSDTATTTLTFGPAQLVNFGIEYLAATSTSNTLYLRVDGTGGNGCNSIVSLKTITF